MAKKINRVRPRAERADRRQMVIRLDPDLERYVRARALVEGKTISQVFVELLDAEKRRHPIEAIPV